MRRFLFAIALAAVFLTSCATGRPGSWSEKCSEPPLNAESFSVDKLPWMVGSFHLTFVATSYEASGVARNDVELFAVDSATRERAREPRLGRSPRRDVRLIGVDYWNRRSPAQPVEWDDGVLYIGCRDCLDASPTKLTVVAVSENGFWGWWRNNQSGIGRVLDKHGRPAADPAGYFCARRMR